MKKPLTILLIALIAGIAAFGITRIRSAKPSGDTLLDQLPELGWLRTELALSDPQFAKVGELHAAYRPICREMCARIEESRARLECAALHNRSLNAELQEAIANYEQVRGECKTRMLGHLYQTAALMSPEQAEKYLKAVLPAALGSPTGGHPHH